jgi:hypothetical protein
MVLQVATDAGQVVARLDAAGRELVGRPDARLKQQVG